MGEVAREFWENHEKVKMSIARDNADCVVTHNGKRCLDMRKLMAKTKRTG